MKVYLKTDDMLFSGGNGTGLSFYIKYAEAVSYTHLDVYKRQMYREEMHYKDIYYEEAEKQNKEVQKLKHDMKPVSYTHLDVYKRQIILLTFQRQRIWD